MNTGAYKIQTQDGTGDSVSRVLIISLIFVALLVVAWLIGRNVIEPAVVDRTEEYRGMVQLPSVEWRGCEQFELDNKSGSIKPKGFTECGNIAPTQSSGSYGTGSLGRLNGIADHFRSH